MKQTSMKALAAAVFAMLTVLIVGCGSGDRQPALPTVALPATLPTKAQSPTRHTPSPTVEVQPPPATIPAPSPTHSPIPHPTPRPTPTNTPPAPLAKHETDFLRSLSPLDRFCVPPHIRSDDQYWELTGRVTPYDTPETRPQAFNCLSDDGKFRTYIMSYSAQFTNLSAGSEACLLETTGQFEHSPNDPEAREEFNAKVLFSTYFITAYCLTDEELGEVDILDSAGGLSELRCLMTELGGPQSFVEIMIKPAADDLEQRLIEADMACSGGEEPPRTPKPTP